MSDEIIETPPVDVGEITPPNPDDDTDPEPIPLPEPPPPVEVPYVPVEAGPAADWESPSPDVPGEV